VLRSLSAALALVGLALSGASAGPGLRAGAARIDITPDAPLALEGYLNPENRISTGVHDRLYARAVAFAVGTKRLVLVSCDLGSFALGPYFLRLIADKWALGPDEVFLCATHTHSGPQLSLNADYPHPNNFRYTKALERTLVELTGKALAAVTPARVAVGRGQAEVGVSRRTLLADGRVEMAPNPGGVADHEVLVLRLSRAGGAPLAVLFDYASHSRSLRGTNRLVSGDIFGIAEQLVEQAGSRGLVGAAFAGASGDIDPVSVVDGFEMPGGGVPPTTRLGQRLGEEVARAAGAAAQLTAPVAIRTASARLQLPPKVAGQAKWVNVIVARVGDIAFVGLDCEASVEVGLAIKSASPFKATFVITNCNGWAGYLPTARQHEEGGYEVARTGFGPGAADILVREALAMLSRLR
jgi:neutral ceramidase